MTNADKYLKDRVSVYKFTNDIEEKHKYLKGMIQDFFNTPIPPTLTEEERVILRNIDKKYKAIERAEDKDLLVWADNGINTMLPYTNLFQFIKERRRIRDKRTFERRRKIMLKIKDNVDLKQLEKYGLKYYKPFERYEYLYGSRYNLGIKIDTKDRLIEISGGEFDNIDDNTTNILYDLIQADIVEKC